ncbi:MAG: hypothetical protein R3Y54_12620 [Eubacteriales bacterium]
MKKTISIMTETFQNEKTGESVEGVTIMVDGMLKEMLNIIQHNNSEYKDNVSIVKDALLKGLQLITEELK